MTGDEGVPETGSSSLPGREDLEEGVSRIASWRDWESIAAQEHAREMQRLVNDIFREELMGALALLLIPILLLLQFGDLSPVAASFLNLLDVAIWLFFVLEYICRLQVASDRLAFVKAPWHVLDLVIIGVPAVALLAGVGFGLARYLRVLRVMQAVQVLNIGVKKAKKQIDKLSVRTDTQGPLPVMQVRALPITAYPDGSPDGNKPAPEHHPAQDPVQKPNKEPDLNPVREPNQNRAEKPTQDLTQHPVPAQTPTTNLARDQLSSQHSPVPASVPFPSPPPPPPAWSGADIRDTSGKLRRDGLWVDICGFTEADVNTLATMTGVPAYVLQVKLRERAFPRAELDGNSMTVFLQVPCVSATKKEYNFWEIQWKGLLVGFDRAGVMTFSRIRLPVLDEVAAAAPGEGITLNGPGVLYLVVNSAMNAIEDMILSAEEQLLYLEVQPMNQLPQNFLSMMYADQKEIGRINSGLLHTKTALETVYNCDRSLFGMTEEEAGRLRSLADRCSLLSDSSQHMSDSFAWMVDFYLNTNSFSMNRVMKILAVLTALTMVPAVVGGLLGMNLIGNPWPATLLQMVTGVALIMILTAWLYYNLGWLKR